MAKPSWMPTFRWHEIVILIGIGSTLVAMMMPAYQSNCEGLRRRHKRIVERADDDATQVLSPPEPSP